MGPIDERCVAAEVLENPLDRGGLLGAISYLLYTSLGMSTENSARGLTFIDAKPVHFPERLEKWANDFGGSAAYATAAIHDLDGSFSGVPDS